MPSTNKTPVIEIGYACFGRALHGPAIPSDICVVTALNRILAAVLALPFAAGLIVIFLLLLGISPALLLRWVPWPA